MIDATTIGIVDEPFLRTRQPYGAFLESHRAITATPGAAHRRFLSSKQRNAK